MTDAADMFETGFAFPEKVTGSSCLWSAAGCNTMDTVGSGPLVSMYCIGVLMFIAVVHMWVLRG